MTDGFDASLETPFFVVGPVRSGTTLLRLLLGHHPSICRCEEMEYLTPWLVGRDDWPEIGALRTELARDRGFRLSGYAMPPHGDLPALARDLFAQRRRLDGRPIFGAVVHNHFDELPRLFPAARFVFLHRDPRDVARSCVEMGWAGTPYHGAEKWLEAHAAWARLRERVPAERWLELRFEALVDAPDVELARACAFLGTAYDPRMLEIDADTTYSRPRRGESRSWRETATADEVAQVETRIGREILVEAGYVPSGNEPLRLSATRRIRLAWAELRGRVGFRIRRYGFGLWLASLFASRAPIGGLREWTQERIDGINNRHMK